MILLLLPAISESRCNWRGRNRSNCFCQKDSGTAKIKSWSDHHETMQKITPFLWFDNQAEEAVKFFTSIFKNSRIGKIARYDESGEKIAGRPAGSVMTVEFQLQGQKFIALN